jgi:hypothetical protein
VEILFEERKKIEAESLAEGNAQRKSGVNINAFGIN